MSEADDQSTGESRSLFKKFKVSSWKAELIRDKNRCIHQTKQERNQSMDIGIVSPIIIHIPPPPLFVINIVITPLSLKPEPSGIYITSLLPDHIIGQFNLYLNLILKYS